MRTHSRRTTELLLLIAAAPVVLLIFAMLTVHRGGPLTLQSLAVPLGLFVAFAVAQLAVRRFAPAADPALLPVAFVLSGIGLAFVMRLDPTAGSRQLAWLILSVAAMVATLAWSRTFEWIRRYRYTIGLAGIVLLLLPALVGTEVNGAKLWLIVGGVSFQPGELAKILMVLFLGAYLAENREMLSVATHRVGRIVLPSPKVLFPLVVVWALSLVVVVFERDLGSALLFFGIFLVMLYTATGRFGYVAVGAGLGLVGGLAAWAAFSHVQTRIAIWLDPFAYAQDRGYQLVQSLYALADGGLFGVGIDRGMPTRIPYVSTDFIFSAIGEELGLLGAAAVILLYLILLFRGLSTAARAKSDTVAIVAAGLVTAISLQAFVIIGGVTRLIPLTGVTLPFMSRGGSSLLSSFIILGLLLRAGDEGTGDEVEMETNSFEGGTLGRYALGRRLTTITIVFAVVFALLIGNLTYIQTIQADELTVRLDNTRALTRASQAQLGSILTSDGVVLATSVDQGDGKYARAYPEGSLASHLIGYTSITYGRAGIESAQVDVLTGQRTFATWNDVIDAASGRPTAGNDVVLTIDSRVQRAAEQALAGRVGAIVALDPRTGATLASASSPTYAPSDLESVLGGANDDGRLLDRTRSALYPPGSTFKVVTLTRALGSGIATADRTFDAPASLEIGGAPITNYDGSSATSITLEAAFARSFNTVFAELADEMGPRQLVDQSNAFGFGRALGRDLPARPSLMPVPGEMTKWETAWAGVGQPVGEHASPAGPQASVVQLASIAASIANQGTVLEPYLVDRILDESGRVLQIARPNRIGRATDVGNALEVARLMESVVEGGTGRPARISGVRVAGKTGTAEVGKSSASHTLFIGFAPVDDPKIAIAVIVEHGDGSVAASALARDVLAVGLDR